MKYRFAVSAPLLLLLTGTLLAQKQPPSGGSGNNPSPGMNVPNFPTPTQGVELDVRIAWPNERTVDESIHVQLLNSTNVPVQDTFSQRDGRVSFHAVMPGSYKLKMDGADIKDTVSEVFNIYPQERSHMEWVHVAPKENTQNAVVPGAGPTVSATELNVPPKAQNELDKGMEAFAKGDLKKADEKLEKAVQIYPKYARAWNNLGVVRMKESNKDGARDAWMKCIEADGKFSSAYLNLARLSMMDKNMPEADSYIKKALTANPNNVEGLALLAKEQLLTGQYDQALLNARKVHTLPHEHMADSHLIAGEALLHQNRNAEAVAEYELYLKEYPDSPNAATVRKAMAQIQAKQQKPETN